MRLDPQRLKALDDAAISGLSDEQRKQLYAQANKALIAELSQQQQESLKQLIGERFEKEFLHQPLYAGKNRKSRTERAARTSLARLVSSQKDATEIDLDDDQKTQLNSIRSELVQADRFDKKIAEVLSKDQVSKFNRIAVTRQIRQWGTVRGLANGYLVELLSIGEKEAEALLSKGKQLDTDLKLEIKKIEWEKIIAALDQITNDRMAFQNLMGN